MSNTVFLEWTIRVHIGRFAYIIKLGVTFATGLHSRPYMGTIVSQQMS